MTSAAVIGFALRQTRISAAVQDNILTRQIAGLAAAQKRRESAKFLWLAKTTRWNQVAHAMRLIFGRMTGRFCRKFEVFS